MQVSRRKFIKGATASIGLASLPHITLGASKKVVVVGGGTAGVTAAKYLRMADPTIQVTLIEANKDYYTCYMSNEVLSGERTIDSIRFGYHALRRHGVRVVQDRVTGIDARARTVKTRSGRQFGYDRCIVAPGIDFRWESIEGYDAQVAEEIPHAWKAGSQTISLRRQLEAMPDGGRVVIAAPPNPFRCPPGPYERASQIAHYLQGHKPRSKILILDAKPHFAKMELFLQGWKALYGYQSSHSLIEWRGSAQGSNDNAVVKVDRTSRTVTTGFEETIKADVLNLIPAQKAGAIAFAVGLTDASGWCPVDLLTFESTLQRHIHVVGDASVTRGIPKSGYAANSEAKVCAAAVAALLNGRQPGTPVFVDTCYSIVGREYGISGAGVYRLARDGSQIVKVAGGLSSLDAGADIRKREVAYAHSWFTNITQDIFM